MDVDYLVSRYMNAAALLPYGVQETFEAVSKADKAAAEEFRLRAGFLPSILTPSGEKTLGNAKVTPKNLYDVLEIATESSLHSAKDSIRGGFVTGFGGHRIGICGTAVMKDGSIDGIRSVSSLTVRIAKEIRDCGKEAAEKLFEDGKFISAIVISPPGGGKTTMLRDIVRILSNAGRRVALADERDELAGVRGGVPQMDVGLCTDVLSGCPRDEAVMLLLRTMNPEIIAMDEITAPRDAKALENAFNCGVGLIATAHASDISELSKRGLYRELLSQGIFKKAVVITKTKTGRASSVVNLAQGSAAGAPRHWK